MTMTRKLASIQKIESVAPIPNADAIEVATVLGWHVVVKKGEYAPGDMIVYVETDSVLPEHPAFEFLRKCCYIDKNGCKGFRVKTAKLRGQISQGIIFSPLEVLRRGSTIYVGQDVTQRLGIVKYDPPIPVQLSGLAKGNFPSFIPKTDEMRLQAVPGVLDRHRGKRFYVTEKLDGTSATYYMNGGEFGVCSRNLELKPSETNAYWQIDTRYDIKGALESAGGNYAIQGEIIGPGIQKNKYGLKTPEFKIFSVYDIAEGGYLGIFQMKSLLERLGFDDSYSVPCLGTIDLDHSVDDLVSLSEGQSRLNGVQREGIVLRPIEEENDIELGRLSFKVINPKFLLKHGE